MRENRSCVTWMPDSTPKKSLTSRLIVLLAGLVFFGAQVLDHSTTGRASDPTLVYASLVLVAAGLGFSVDWFRKL